MAIMPVPRCGASRGQEIIWDGLPDGKQFQMLALIVLGAQYVSDSFDKGKLISY